LAKQRFRHQGRFIKKEDREKLDPDQIYDPNIRQTPKIKPIFKISKEHNRSSSCCSSNSGYKVSKAQPLIGDSKDVWPSLQDLSKASDYSMMRLMFPSQIVSFSSKVGLG
jgi:hypothetical protein